MLLLLALLTPAHALPREQVADPRPQSHVADPLGRLSAEERARIDEAARGVHHGEVLVVVVDTTDGEAPRAYGTALFNAWGVARAGQNDGVLLLAALDDRKAEIVLGDGIDGPAYTAVTDRIMAGVLVPNFKANQPANALFHGTRAVAAQVLGAAPPPPVASTSALPWGIGLGLGLGGLAGALMLALFALLTRRHRPRACPRCRRPMARLAEHLDDAHLSAGEQKEEALGSVDYDVWACPCGHAEKIQFGALFTRYSRCRKCQHRTSLRTDEVVMQPTNLSPGIARIYEQCEHCGHFEAFSRELPVLSDSSTSGSSTTTWSHDSSFSSGSSGGSSGGSSSGGGSSGSW